MTLLGFEITVPVLLLGLVTGMTYGILAVGLVLIYRSNRIINFAHGEIGVFAAAIMGIAVTQHGVPYWVALPLALAVGAGVGAAAEIVVVRRLRHAPAIMSVVATLGLAGFLLLFSLVVNRGIQAGRLFPTPPGLPEFDVGALFMSSAYTAMLVLTPVVVLALTIFLRRSRFGLAIRAAAANPDAARLSAVSTSRMSALSWGIAGALAALTAILVLPTRGVISAEFLGPGLLLRALTAAVVARMTNLPVALVTGIAVGVVEHLLLWNDPQGGLVEMILFSIILVVLVLQRRQGAREEEKGSWAAVQPWPPLPERYQAVWAIRNLGRIAAAVALVAALTLPLVITNATAIILVVVMSFALVGLSLGVVTGLSGQLSLGQFALAGVGAFASFQVTWYTGSFLLGFFGAGLAAAAVSLVIGLPALRIRGLMLAVTTLGFALAAQGWVFQQAWWFGEALHPGRPVIGDFAFDTGRRYYYVALAALVAGLWLARNVWTSGLGRRLRAIRDNEPGARAFTVPATAVKLQGFAVAGFLAGLGGAAYGHALSQLNASVFPVESSISVVALTALGGLGVLSGPLFGALYIVGLPAFLPLDTAALAATSLGWLLVILYFPGGIAQAFRPARDRLVDRLAARHGLAPLSVQEEDAEEPLRSGFAVPGARVERAAAGEVVLEARALTRRFGGITAVDGVTLAVRQGETVGLIGPNGAGKTTLFELISGFQRANSGQVLLAGEDLSGLPPDARGRRGLIRSFQDAGLFPTMTVLETMMLSLERASPTRAGPALVGRTAADRAKEVRARELIGEMGLHAFRHKQILELSTGTRRITELACLVSLEPDVLLLDEPSSGIAQRETEALGDLLARLKDDLDLTLVVIEHDIPLVMRISDRVIAMDLGRVIADGSPEQVRNDPLVVETYLGGDSAAIERSDAVRTP